MIIILDLWRDDSISCEFERKIILKYVGEGAGPRIIGKEIPQVEIKDFTCFLFRINELTN